VSGAHPVDLTAASVRQLQFYQVSIHVKEPIYCATALPAGRLLTADVQGTLTIWDSSTGRRQTLSATKVAGPRTSYRHLSSDASGRVVSVAGGSKPTSRQRRAGGPPPADPVEVCLWEGDPLLPVPRCRRQLTFAPAAVCVWDGGVAVGSDHGTELLEIWQASDLQCIKQVTRPEGLVSELRGIHPLGQDLLVCLLHLPGKGAYATVIDVSGSNPEVGPLLKLDAEGAGESDFCSCVILPDKSFLTSTSSATKLWRGEEEVPLPPTVQGLAIVGRFSDGGLLWKKSSGSSELLWTGSAMDMTTRVGDAGRAMKVLTNGILAGAWGLSVTFLRLREGWSSDSCEPETDSPARRGVTPPPPGHWRLLVVRL
jgi:hypothetical protein